MNRLATLLLFCFFSFGVYGQSVVYFSKRLKDFCSPANDILAKKIFLTILKVEKGGHDPCANDGLSNLLSNCGKNNSCDDVLMAYHESVYKHEGKVLGQ